jgi:hypothetical protein
VSTRRYATARDFKQALEVQIRRRAEASQLDLALVRQRCVFERFLARLAAVFGDRVTAKGGVVLALRLERVRVTRDVDLRVSGSPSRVLAELRTAGQLAIGPDFMTFSVEPDPVHPLIEAEGMVYGGQRFRVEAQLAGQIYGSRFGVDVAFGDAMARPPEIVVGSDLFAFAGIPPVEVRAYAREVHVAEKLHAFTLPRTRANSRVKDLPDLALLALTGPFDGAAVRDAIRDTFDRRATHSPPSELPAPPEAWRPLYARMAQQNALRWATLDEVTGAVRAFLDPVLHGQNGVWSPGSWSWG